MSENKSSFFQQTLTAGLLLGIVLVVYSLLMYFLDMSTNKYIGWISYLIIAVVIYYLQVQHRNKDLNGFMSYGKALGFAVMSMLVASVISAIFNFIMVKFIDPGLITKIMSMQEEAMAKRGMTAEQTEMAMKMTAKMMSPVFMSIFTLIGMMFWGTVVSLITSIFTRKEANPVA
jgi:hypothetical protein